VYIKDVKPENINYYINSVSLNAKGENISAFYYIDSSLYKKYQIFSPSLINLFKEKNIIEDLHEFTLRDLNNDLNVLDCYWFNTKIEKQNDTIFNFYLKTYFPINNIDSLEQAVTLKYKLTLKSNNYSIELDSSYQALPKLASNEINIILQKYSRLKKLATSGKDNNIQKEIYLLDYELVKGALSGSKRCAQLFTNMENDFKNYLDPVALEAHKNTLLRILSDYGYVKAPHSSISKRYKRTYAYQK
jgi:uncharacterized protein (DUF2344 family)